MESFKKRKLLLIICIIAIILILFITILTKIKNTKGDSTYLDVKICNGNCLNEVYNKNNKVIYYYDVYNILVNESNSNERLLYLLELDKNNYDNILKSKTDLIDSTSNTNIYKVNNNYSNEDIYIYECNTNGSSEIYIGTDNINKIKNVCSLKETKCLTDKIDTYITSEVISPNVISISSILDIKEEQIEYSIVKRTNFGIYVLIKTDNNEIIDTVDEYFKSKHDSYNKIDLKNNYHLFIYSDSEELNTSDFNSCLKETK